MSERGSNFTRLLRIVVARFAVGDGNRFVNALKFFLVPKHRRRVIAEAEGYLLLTLQLVKATPDNPYGDDDEAIAAAILAEYGKKRAK